jgi:hypothetical protein
MLGLPKMRKVDPEGLPILNSITMKVPKLPSPLTASPLTEERSDLTCPTVAVAEVAEVEEAATEAASEAETEVASVDEVASEEATEVASVAEVASEEATEVASEAETEVASEAAEVEIEVASEEALPAEDQLFLSKEEAKSSDQSEHLINILSKLFQFFS